MMHFSQALPDATEGRSSPLSGLYVHIPFCATKCNYCDFSTAVFDEAVVRRYLSALIREIHCVEVPSLLRSVDSIYIGGGTPSIVSEHFIGEILEELARKFTVAAEAEISLEMNPSPREAQRIGFYRSAGINRLSIGVQSFNDAELTAMTRAHTADDARAAVDRARRDGVRNISIDLILGLPGQTRLSVRPSVDAAVSLPVDHLSLYILELHSGTPLHGSIRAGKAALPSDDFVGRQYLDLVAALESHGLQQYEISNFARPGFQSRHNWKYWRRVPYLGFGVSSHSFDGVRRWNNIRSLRGYLERIESGTSPRENEAEVSAVESLQEQIFLGMRTCRGVHALLLDALVDKQDRLRRRWPWFLEQGWVKRADDRYFLTPPGFLVSNEILSEFM
jgi:oxygen-independent coproporphyrinogen-3 oxidase